MTPVSPKHTAIRATPEDIVRQLTHLPSAPRVLPRLKRLLSDGNSSLHEVVAMVRLDPGIAARVLQIGNSVYFSHGLRCYTVDEAVNRIGYDQIYGLVSTAVASEVLVRPLDSYSISADELWENSIACACAAELLAQRAGLDRDIAYTIGLLHRVGMIAIDEWITHSGSPIHFTLRPLPLETCEQERAALGFHNAEAGAALLRLWDFPTAMTEPVRWQYMPQATAAHGQLSSLLSIAKWVRTTALSPDQPPMALDPLMLRRAGVPHVDLNELIAGVRQKLTEISDMLDTNEAERCTLNFPGGERDIFAIR